MNFGETFITAQDMSIKHNRLKEKKYGVPLMLACSFPQSFIVLFLKKIFRDSLIFNIFFL